MIHTMDFSSSGIINTCTHKNCFSLPININEHLSKNFNPIGMVCVF